MASLSCGGGGSQTAAISGPRGSFTPVLSWVKVSVSPLTIEVGKTGMATPQASTRNGGPFGAIAFAFTSSAPEVASVDATGTIRGVAPGTAAITAASGGKEASHDVTVVPVVVARVVVSPALATLDPGTTVSFAVELFDAAGAEVAGREVSWSSSDTSVAVITAEGLVTARSAGRAKITAAVDAQYASAW